MIHTFMEIMVRTEQEPHTHEESFGRTTSVLNIFQGIRGLNREKISLFVPVTACPASKLPYVTKQPVC